MIINMLWASRTWLNRLT